MLNTIKDKITQLISGKTVPIPIKCSACGNETTDVDLKENFMVCPKCGKYMRVGARDRIAMVTDEGSFKELFKKYKSIDFMDFPGYKDKLDKAISATGENDAVICGTAKINGQECAIFVMDSRFMMASMGSVVGEKITKTFETAIEKKLPVIGFTASGGARMQEGIISLMQMAKVSGAVKKHSEAGLLYITVLTDPTTGGVTASFAMQGDILLTEPKALIGFAGRRVVEQTTKTELPSNFQTAEFLLEHGFIDMIVERKSMRRTLAHILKLHNHNNCTAVASKEEN